MHLAHANMRGADMSGATLWGVRANLKELKSMHIETYDICFTKTFLQVGCMGYLTDEWRNFSDEDIANMGDDALVFWHKWKDFIFQAIELSFPEEDNK